MSVCLELCAAIVFMLPPPQLDCPPPNVLTQSTHSIKEGKRWTAWLAAPEAGSVLVEIEPKAKGTDLDLCLHMASEKLREARSHRGREQLLVTNPRGPLRIEVHGPLSSTFDLRVVNLKSPKPMNGPAIAIELGPNRVGSWSLKPTRSPRLARLALLKGDADWRIYDSHGELLAVGERRGGERAWLPPSGDVLAVLVPRSGAEVRGSLQVSAGAAFRSPLREFLGALSKTPDQRKALETLARHPDFLRIVSYLEGYPDGMPIALRAKPGLQINGVERFGAYRERVLTINPTIAPHQENVQELVDTVVHELIHAVLDLPPAPGFPFGAEVKDSLHDPLLRGYSSSSLRRGNVPPPIKAYLAREYGPSASNPERDFSDLNAGGQRLIVKLIRDNRRRTGLGAETLVFQNERARRARSTK